MLPANALTDTVEVELIHENIKYLVNATRCGPESYFLDMNNCGVRVEFHNLNDGAVLLSYGANSYTCYMKEEVDK